MISDPFSQSGYRCRIAWGMRGAAETAARGDIVVVVDVLSFSSAVATAVNCGAVIIPCANADEARQFSLEDPNIIEAVRRGDASPAAYSLSPVSYLSIPRGTTVALPSLNGAACCRAVAPNTQVFAGCLLNAACVAEQVREELMGAEIGVTVLACGEQWEEPHEEGRLRFAIEDYLGVGAILSELPFSMSPEAQVCAGAFLAMRGKLIDTIWNCSSGLELRKRGYAQDVEHASMLNIYDSAPRLRNGRFELYG